MKHNQITFKILLLAAGLLASGAMAQADLNDPRTTGPSPDLVAPYSTPSARIIVKTIPFPQNEGPKVHSGFKVEPFAEGLESARQVVVLPNGDVLVAEATTEKKPNDPTFKDKGANRIRLLRDKDGDGKAETKTILMSSLRQPYGMVYTNQRLYVADTDGIFWIPFKLGTTEVSEKVKKTRIAEFKPGGYNNHWTRNLQLSKDGKVLYVAIGSASNAGEYGEDEEVRRASILKIDLKTGKETLFASGIRNPVGMALEPKSGVLWTSVNERDELGDDLVPDYITSVKEGGFYGWPYSYYGQNEDPRLKGQRPDLVAKAIKPDYAVGPHVSALGIVFGAKTAFPARFREGVFVGRHGSWNRQSLIGYDVVFIPFTDGKPSGPMELFLSGFTADTDTVYGRPRSLAVAKDGSLLVTDDKGGFIYRITADSASK
ncbi:PQQ-dependent sugar dehydrogenase [Asticcacaulis machinosus]|uniref:Sorbosone dehydrogenase family protein n=1 Tax=Asticcacaulis machinosus TaxID=2984211 RepID=A0ABT5HH37_9CAUL|nr:sorbosone dehydrogenase family protein [Asticcacaulis machinosus]MDC7675569.1 sorbosone dehydrogenase family protein [Asticcacaulis machinosus]